MTFVLLEGPDGAGKDTQADMLAAYWQERGEAVRVLDFPWLQRYAEDTPFIINKIREALRATRQPDPYMDQPHDNATEALLHLALMRQIMVEMQARWTRRPSVHVIWVRGWLSTLAYQVSQMDRADREAFPLWWGWAVIGRAPDRIFLLDISPEVAAKRLAGRQGNDAIDYDLARQQAVRTAYLRIQSQRNYHVLDGDQPADAIHSQIVSRLEQGRKT